VLGRNIDGMFDQPHLVNIPRAIRKDPCGPNANDQLSASEFRQERVGIVQGCFAKDAKPLRALEVDKE
jgi:hypothetical protein